MANEEIVPAFGGDLVLGDDDLQGVQQRPKSLSDDLTGTEGIGPDDIRLPRLCIAQGLSHQLLPGNSRYIKDLRMFDFFNDLTTDIYGPAENPIKFVCCRRDVRGIEFIPREEGGGIVDLNVPLNDPRMAWTVENGTRIPPKATRFTEFVVMLLRPGKQPEPIVLSIKDTNKWNRLAATNLTTYIGLRRASIFSGLYAVSAKPETNDKGTFGVYIVKNAGFLDVDQPRQKAIFDYAADFAKSLEGKNIVVERDTSTVDHEAGDTSFDPSKMDTSQPSGAPAM